VDGADFVVWQTNFPSTSGRNIYSGDADGDGDVDGADFVSWQTHFPTSPGPVAAFGSGSASNGPLSGENLLAGRVGSEEPDANSVAAASSRSSAGATPAVIVAPVFAASRSIANGTDAATEISPQISTCSFSAIQNAFTTMPSTPCSTIAVVSSPGAQFGNALDISNPTVEIDSVGTLGRLVLTTPFDGLGVADGTTTPLITEGYRNSAGALGLSRFLRIEAIDELHADSLLDTTDELCHELAVAVCEDGQADAQAGEYAELLVGKRSVHPFLTRAVG
jgi:hypothetical protein